MLYQKDYSMNTFFVKYNKLAINLNVLLTFLKSFKKNKSVFIIHNLRLSLW